MMRLCLQVFLQQPHGRATTSCTDSCCPRTVKGIDRRNLKISSEADC